MPITASTHDALASNHAQPPQGQPAAPHQQDYAYPPSMHPEASAPPQTWQASNGIAPVSLVDAAASHLTGAVVELIKVVKIRPTPAGELEVADDFS